MAEYIEREEAMHIAFKSPFFSDALMEEMKAIPAADVAPVRHGRWVQCKYADKSAKCSECGGYYTRFTVNERYPKYCPNCGAMMDLEG